MLPCCVPTVGQRNTNGVYRLDGIPSSRSESERKKARENMCVKKSVRRVSYLQPLPAWASQFFRVRVTAIRPKPRQNTLQPSSHLRKSLSWWCSAPPEIAQNSFGP